MKDGLGVMVFKAILNNILVILWRSVVLVEKTSEPEENPPTCHKSLTNFIT
jgi:hypothetical protein